MEIISWYIDAVCHPKIQKSLAPLWVSMCTSGSCMYMHIPMYIITRMHACMHPCMHALPAFITSNRPIKLNHIYETKYYVLYKSVKSRTSSKNAAVRNLRLECFSRDYNLIRSAPKQRRQARPIIIIMARSMHPIHTRTHFFQFAPSTAPFLFAFLFVLICVQLLSRLRNNFSVDDRCPTDVRSTVYDVLLAFKYYEIQGKGKTRR